MKLRKIVVAFLLVWAGSSWAGLPLEAQDQGRKFTVRVENVTMKEAIEAIKEKGDYSFLIRNKDIDLTRKVTVDVNEGQPYRSVPLGTHTTGAGFVRAER